MSHWSFEKLAPERFFKSNLNTVRATIFCLLLALINKSLLAWIYTDLVGDKSLYLLFAKQILEGNHPLEPLGFINGQPNYSYNAAFTSPLYSLLALPLLWATKSYYATSFMIDIISWAMLLTGLYRFAFIAFKGRWAANLLVLCAGFFLYPHELGSGPKDTFSIGCMLWIAVLIKDFMDKPVLSKSLLLSFFIISLGLMKLLYGPITLVFLAFLWVTVYKAKTKRHFIHAAVVSSVCIVAFLSLFFYLQFLQDLHLIYNLEPRPNVSYIQKGLYPESLKSTFPFISSVILNVNFWCVQLSDILNAPFQTIGRGFQIFDLILTIPVILFLKYVIKRQQYGLVWKIGIAVSLTILFMLVYMSLTNRVSYENFGSNWTYVQEPRSYLFIIVFLQVALFYLVFYSSAPAALKNFLLVLFIIECLHGFYFTTKQTINNSFNQQARNSNAVEKTVSFLQNANASASFAYLSTPDQHLRHFAHLHNVPIISFSRGACTTLNSSLEQPLIVVLYPGSSFKTDSCTARKTLVTTDTIPPFVIRLYLN